MFILLQSDCTQDEGLDYKLLALIEGFASKIQYHREADLSQSLYNMTVLLKVCTLMNLQAKI